MKVLRVKLHIFLILLTLKSYSQTVSSSCTGPDSIVKMWIKSADKLAVRRAVYISDTYKDSVRINKQLSAFYLKALMAVYNATGLAARDTIMAGPIVVDYYIPYDLNSILFQGDSSKAWVKNLRDSIFPCGNAAIDQLISKYYLKRVGYKYGTIFPSNLYITFSFRTDSNCYINKLCDKFSALNQQGVGISQPNNENRSDGFNITDSVNTNFTELTYSYGWGGCMIPCMYRRYWKFRVYNDCSVEYKGSYGQALPFNPFSGLWEQEQADADIKVFPNPANARLNFLSEGPAADPFDITILNSLGQIVAKRQNILLKDGVDITSLRDGVYYIELCNDQGRYTSILFKGQ